MDWSFDKSEYLLLLLLLPLLAFLMFHFLKWKKRKKEAFADTVFINQLFNKQSKYSYFIVILYIGAFLFLILSITDVLKGKEEMKTKQKFGNVVFMLDVSNSMNVEDVSQNRLTLEKQIVIDALHKMSNDRVGVVIFAGDAVSIMPLTTDYSAVETYISSLETSVISKQGTDFLKGMQQVAALYKNTNSSAKNCVIISDGEDNEGHDKDAANFARQQGIKVTTIGVGTDAGGPVPTYEFGQLMDYITDSSGDPVISKRQTDALKNIASTTGGTYIDGNSSDVLQQVNQALKNLGTDVSKVVSAKTSIHYYQWFLAISLFLFFIIYLTNPKRDLNI